MGRFAVWRDTYAKMEAPIVFMTRLYRIFVRSLVVRACGDDHHTGCFSTQESGMYFFSSALPFCASPSANSEKAVA